MPSTCLRLFFLLALAFVAPVAAQPTLKVAAGADSLRAALDKAAADPSITELLLADGVYEGSFQVSGPKDAKPDLPRLTIRAAEGAKPLFRYARHVTEAEAVEGKPGLYRIKGLPPSEPQMWERDTRVRYFTLSNASSVAAFAGSCFDDRATDYLYFRTSDGQPPAKHDLWLALCSQNSRALAVYRDNVTLDGLAFADFVNNNALAIQSYGDNLLIRNCRFDNCETGWGVDPKCDNSTIENCVGVDVSRCVYSNGNDVTIRNNRFEKIRDRFLYETYPQNDTAYQVYSPGKGGIIEGNFCKGYLQAIFIKASDAPYVIRHNTVIDSHMAIGFSSGMPEGAIVSHNICVDARSFLHVIRFHDNTQVDYNVMWQPREIGEFANRMEVIRGANRGKHNILADPLFVDAANGDYRLLPGSPALAMTDKDGKPAGAYGAATVDDAKKSTPTLELAFQSDSKPYGATGDYTFERDSWIGGGMTHIRELSEGGAIKRLTGNPWIVVNPRAFDPAGQITKLRFSVDGGQPQTIDFNDTHKLDLPAADGDHRVKYEVQNDRGTWSKPAEAVVRVDRHAPKVVGLTHVHANAHGMIVNIETDEPCFAELRFGASPDALTGRQTAPPLIKRSWDANDGGEWVETRRVPRTQHAIAVLTPDVPSGKTVHYQVVFTDQAGLSSTSPVHEARISGEPRTVNIGPGSMTLQQAVDQALPGDRIVVHPGTYTTSTFVSHGGVEGAPITIEAAPGSKPGDVTLDSARLEISLIHLENAPYVTIRGLRILFFKKAGIYAYRSPHTTIDKCVFYNGQGWITGCHTFAMYSPYSTVTNCLAIGAEIGFYFLVSPHATVLHNTASQHMYCAAAYPYSLAGTTQMYNSFAYAGNDIYSGEIGHPDELKTFRSDYNNLGADVMGYNPSVEKTDPALWAVMKAEAFAPGKYEKYIQTVSKAIVGVGTRYLTLKQWREKTGQDMHSIFADPKYVRPWFPIDSWDWRVKADSPNLKVRDEKGQPIGAFGAVE